MATINTMTALAKAYALHLKHVIPRVARNLCYGCEVDHPSQVQHNVCLMMTEEERIRHCLRTAVDQLNEKKVMGTFRRVMSFDTCLHHPAYAFEEAWRSQLWEDDVWVDNVVEELLQLGA